MDLNGVVWRMESVCSLDYFLSFIPSSSPRPCETDIPFFTSTPLSGVVRHLTKRFGGHVCDTGVVDITSTPEYHGNITLQARNLADLDATDHWFSSTDIKNAWFCFDFKDRRVRVTHYSIQSWQGGQGELMTWKVDGSEDGKNWTVLDRHQESSALLGGSTTGSFQIENPTVVRMIRVTQTGTSHDNDYQLCCGAFEVFGTLLEWPGS
jgi:hypothetical protein